MKIYIVSGNASYNRLFISIGLSLTADMNEADMICFTGGEDVTPALYGDAQHPRTMNSVYRDTKEAQIYDQCREKNIPMVGICRG